jgi:hypothetical protein
MEKLQDLALEKAKREARMNLPGNATTQLIMANPHACVYT